MDFRCLSQALWFDHPLLWCSWLCKPWGLTPRLKLFHQLNQYFYTLDIQGVINTDTNAWVWGMALELKETGLLSSLKELELKTSVGRWVLIWWVDPEWNVDLAPEFLINWVGIESMWAIDHVIDHRASLLSEVLVGSKASIFNHVGGVESCDIDWVASWGVEVTIWWLVEKVPIQQVWSVLGLVSNKILSDDANSATRCSEILLGTCIDHAVLWPISLSWANVWAHVTDHWYSLRDKMEWEVSTLVIIYAVLKLVAMDSLVLAVVDKWGIRIDLFPLLWLSELGVVGSLTASNLHWLIVCGQHLFGLVDTLVGPKSGSDITWCRAFTSFQKIFDNGSILQGGPSLEKENLVVIWNLQEGA